jgi:hypothetical protein
MFFFYLCSASNEAASSAIKVASNSHVWWQYWRLWIGQGEERSSDWNTCWLEGSYTAGCSTLPVYWSQERASGMLVLIFFVWNLHCKMPVFYSMVWVQWIIAKPYLVLQWMAFILHGTECILFILLYKFLAQTPDLYTRFMHEQRTEYSTHGWCSVMYCHVVMEASLHDSPFEVNSTVFEGLVWISRPYCII